MNYSYFISLLTLLYNVNTISSFVFHGATAPLGVFDPFKFQERNNINTLAKFRESELKHGHWAMISAASIPLIESKTNIPAIHEFDHLPNGLKATILSLILMGEAATIQKGWKNPFVNGTKNYFQLKYDYQPGDLGFEISNHDDVDLYNIELNNGRLAMIASIGMIVQELVTNKPLFPHDLPLINY